MENSNFVHRAVLVHGNKYDYSKSIYKGSKTKVDIICPKHGLFRQTPDNHINGKKGCIKCFYDSFRKTNDDFVSEAVEVHGDKYDYSLVNYTHNQCKVDIICPEHGVFSQYAFVHI